MKKKILVVDDDADILESIETLLNMEGYNAKSTLKGEEVFKLIKEYRPDLIILDLLLSGRDGAEICIDIKNNPNTKHLPVIMISAHPTAREKSLDVGASDFVSKPFETLDFLEVIRRNLKNYSNSN